MRVFSFFAQTANANVEKHAERARVCILKYEWKRPQRLQVKSSHRKRKSTLKRRNTPVRKVDCLQRITSYRHNELRSKYKLFKQLNCKIKPLSVHQIDESVHILHGQLELFYSLCCLFVFPGSACRETSVCPFKWSAWMRFNSDCYAHCLCRKVNKLFYGHITVSESLERVRNSRSVEIIVLFLSCKWCLLLWRRMPLDNNHVALVIGKDRVKNIVENVSSFKIEKPPNVPPKKRGLR